MKTAVRQTSIDHYHTTDFTAQQADILAALRYRGPSCRNEIADYLGMATATVSARVNELVRTGQVVVAEEKRASRVTGVTSEVVYTKEFDDGLF